MTKGDTVRLLMIDDDPDIGAFVRAVAEPLGFAVETHEDSQGFLNACEEGPYDVIILDLTMPNTDGIELLRYLSERHTPGRIFIMSGVDPTLRRMAMVLGEAGNLDMAGIIPKPVRVDELRAILAGEQPAPEGSGS